MQKLWRWVVVSCDSSVTNKACCSHWHLRKFILDKRWGFLVVWAEYNCINCPLSFTLTVMVNNKTKSAEERIHPTDVVLMTNTSHLIFNSVIACGRKADILHRAVPHSAQTICLFKLNEALGDITLTKWTDKLHKNNVLQRKLQVSLCVMSKCCLLTNGNMVIHRYSISAHLESR